jgi:hypothetical protein
MPRRASCRAVGRAGGGNGRMPCRGGGPFWAEKGKVVQGTQTLYIGKSSLHNHYSVNMTLYNLIQHAVNPNLHVWPCHGSIIGGGLQE